jgi:predicted DsbA family dithiol-disulfide isomerase
VRDFDSGQCEYSSLEEVFWGKEYPMATVEITYFFDMLCVWAYISQARSNAISAKFGEIVRIQHRFCSVFGDTAQKINSRWQGKGGYSGFNLHLRQARKIPSHSASP